MDFFNLNRKENTDVPTLTPDNAKIYGPDFYMDVIAGLSLSAASKYLRVTAQTCGKHLRSLCAQGKCDATKVYDQRFGIAVIYWPVFSQLANEIKSAKARRARAGMSNIIKRLHKIREQASQPTAVEIKSGE